MSSGHEWVDGASFAHIVRNEVTGKIERTESVEQHLTEVAQMAQFFAEPFGYGTWAYAAGMLHDLGKYSQEFQARIQGTGTKVDHSTAGAYEAIACAEQLGIPAAIAIAFAVSGHHGGLPDGGLRQDQGKGIAGTSTLTSRILETIKREKPEYKTPANTFDVAMLPEMTPFPGQLDTPNQKYSFAFLTRMLFSCLVDADFLCTERFMTGRARQSASSKTMGQLLSLLQTHLERFEVQDNPVSKARADVLNDCIVTAEKSQGVFTLTGPTGCGKTLSSMRFALGHAVAHDLTRVIYALPFTSIIEQNAQVFKSVFGDDAVLEHHSNVTYDDSDQTTTQYAQAMRLATENWDAPIVVTTNVQFFESLYASKTSQCRKLHNLANSVIVLDEAQMIPIKQVEPCVQALAELVNHYGCTVVLCTATQPALNDLLQTQNLEVKEIVKDPAALFEVLERVAYRYAAELDTNQLVFALAREHQVLCIVNSRAQAKDVYEGLIEHSDEGVFHLSTLMHATHRTQTIAEIAERLKNDEKCIVVSTSLVEAGVDLDFPTVYRALAGIDNIVQAAGRCNRNGIHDKSKSVVWVFEEASASKVANEVAVRQGIARIMMRSMAKAAHDDIYPLGSLEAMQTWARRLQNAYLERRDATNVLRDFREYGMSSLPNIPFKKASRKFQLIDDNSCTVVVPDQAIAAEVKRLEQGAVNTQDMRKLQRYTVSVHPWQLEDLVRSGAVEPTAAEDVWLLLDQGRYGNGTGLNLKSSQSSGLFY